MNDLSVIPYPTLEIVNGEPTVLSTVVAEYYGYKHKNLLRVIHGLLKRNPELERRLIFEPTLVTRQNPNGGAPIQSPAYRMNRMGFEILSMKLSNPRAEKFQISFVQAFEAAFKALQNINLSAYQKAMRLNAKFDERKRQISFYASSMAKWKEEKKMMSIEMDKCQKGIQPPLPFDSILIEVSH